MARTPKAKAATAGEDVVGIYQALTCIEHDGERHEVGDELEMTAAEAAALVECKALKLTDKAPPVPPPPT